MFLIAIELSNLSVTMGAARIVSKTKTKNNKGAMACLYTIGFYFNNGCARK